MKPLRIMHLKVFDALDIPPTKRVLTFMVEKGIFPESQKEIKGATILKNARVYYTLPDAFLKKAPDYETRFIPYKDYWIVLSFPIGTQVRSNFGGVPMFTIIRPSGKKGRKYPVVVIVLGDKQKPVDINKLVEVK